MSLSTPEITEPTAASRGLSKRARAVAAVMLVVLASLGTVVSLVGMWVRSTLFDTESFMEVVETSLASDEVLTVLGDVITDQVVTALDVEGLLETRLGAVDTYLGESLVEVLDLSANARSLLARLDLFKLADLAAPIARPINQGIADSVDNLVRSDAFQETLPDAVAYAHRGAVALIRQDTEELDDISVVDGEVHWYILPSVVGAIEYVLDRDLVGPVVEPVELPAVSYDDSHADAVARLGAALGTLLPEGFGEVTLMTEEQLVGWQSLARSLDRAAVLAIVLTLAFAGAALIVSPSRRRTLVQFAAGSVVAVLVAWIIQRNVLQAVDEAIPGTPEQAAVGVLFEAVFANLRRVSWVYIFVAALIGLVAHVAGRPRWLTALSRGSKREDGPGGTMGRIEDLIEGHRDAFVVGGIVAALVIWSQTGINWLSLVVIGVALAGYLWWLALVVGDASGG